VVYAAELDDSVWEIRRGASGIIRFWPKIVGVGNVQVTATPTATVHKPSSSTTAITTLTPVVRTIDDVTRWDFTVDASDTTTYQLDENYRLDISWTYVDSDAVSNSHRDTVPFDVCRSPMNPRVSLNDLIDEVHDIGARLTTMGRGIGSRTAEQTASVFAAKAWMDVRARLKSSLQGSGKILPRCLIDRSALQRATVAATVRLVFMSTAGDAESESASLRDWWSQETADRIREIGPAADYDADDDAVADATLHGFGSVRVRRAWR